MVKSRRRAASSTLIDGSPVTSKPLVPASGLRFAPRQRDVDVAELEDLKALADELRRVRAPRAARAAWPPGRRRPRCRRPSSSPPMQPVADPAADDERASALGHERLQRSPRVNIRNCRLGDCRLSIYCRSLLIEIDNLKSTIVNQVGLRPQRFTRRSERPGATALTMASHFASGYG